MGKQFLHIFNFFCEGIQLFCWLLSLSPSFFLKWGGDSTSWLRLGRALGTSISLYNNFAFYTVWVEATSRVSRRHRHFFRHAEMTALPRGLFRRTWKLVFALYSPNFSISIWAAVHSTAKFIVLRNLRLLYWGNCALAEAVFTTRGWYHNLGSRLLAITWRTFTWTAPKTRKTFGCCY